MYVWATIKGSCPRAEGSAAEWLALLEWPTVVHSLPTPTPLPFPHKNHPILITRTMLSSSITALRLARPQPRARPSSIRDLALNGRKRSFELYDFPHALEKLNRQNKMEVDNMDSAITYPTFAHMHTSHDRGRGF